MVKQVEVRVHVGRAGIFEKNESLLWRAWPANSLAFGCCVYAHAFCDRPMNAMKAMKTVKTLQEMMSSTSIGLPTRSHLSQRSFGVGGWWTGAETGHDHGRSGIKDLIVNQKKTCDTGGHVSVVRSDIF